MKTLGGSTYIEAKGQIKTLTNNLSIYGRNLHTASCGIIARAFLRSVRPILDTSTPSIVTEPDESSTKRYKAEKWRLGSQMSQKPSTLPVIIELFPALGVLFEKNQYPLILSKTIELKYLPRIPIFSPAFTSIDKPLSTGGSSDRYFKTTSLSTICPFSGHETGGFWSGISCGASCSISVV
jgi:hypothetical protein